MENLSQLKQKADKIYNSRAESHLKSLKEVNSIPKIDPLSRKIAEIITKKEIEVLGIETTEPQLKKPFYSTSLFESSSKPNTKQLTPIPSQPLPKALTPDERPEVKVLAASLPVQENPPVVESSPPLDALKTDENLPSPAKNQEMINNLEHLKAFKEELHRDYPELGLNNSAEGSSFHTNELKELEEACKNMGTDRSAAETGMNREEKQVEIANRLNENGGILVSQMHLAKAPSISSGKGKDDWSDHCKEKGIFRNRSEGFLTHSKQMSLTSDGKDFVNLQHSYLKASFLHSTRENVPKSVPRCHVELNANKASPIYFNVRVAKDSKVKNPNGIGPADCLRKMLLKDPDVQTATEKLDIYERSAQWLRSRREKTQLLRENLESLSFKNGTLGPLPSKKRQTSSRALSQSSLSSSHSHKPKKTLQYIGLSPSDTELRYKKGVDIEKFKSQAKPMVNYRQINFLK